MEDIRIKALTIVDAERNRQIDKWGDESSNRLSEWMGILGEEFGELCKAVNETCLQNATERQFGGVDNIIREASHVAAVAVAIIEANLKQL